MLRIAVVGSINMDLVVETDISPKRGQTVLGKNFFMSPGGKGANQAVAAARLGGEVFMFGSLGKDENGKLMNYNLEKENINMKYINFVENVSTGVALIELCEGDNHIIVVPGANSSTNVEYLDSIKEELLSFDVVIMQMEIPIYSIEYLVNYLFDNNKTIILNPAPAVQLNKNIIDKVTYLTPNEHEYKIIFNTEEKVDEILGKYPNKLIITQGGNGVKYFDGSETITIPSIKVTVKDSTGAGDTFCGALGVAISERKSLYDSIKFANMAGGISVTQKGAQNGMPTREAVMKFWGAVEEIK
jgi:ribokinase